MEDGSEEEDIEDEDGYEDDGDGSDDNELEEPAANSEGGRSQMWHNLNCAADDKPESVTARGAPRFRYENTSEQPWEVKIKTNCERWASPSDMSEPAEDRNAAPHLGTAWHNRKRTRTE